MSRWPDQTLEQRFWAKVETADDCWVWMGARMPRGYGVLNTRGSANLAHRLAWEIAHGAIPDGLSVLHRCDNPPCVRPEHLFLGTQADNQRDMASKGRQRRKLEVADVIEIRRRWLAGGTTHRALAAEFGVHHTQVGRIVRGEVWQSSGGSV